MRLDKFLCEMNIGTRSQVKTYLKQGLISLNGEIVCKPELRIDEKRDVIAYKDRGLTYKKYVYYMLHKPGGVVSATQDNNCTTVTELMKDTGHEDLFPVGRLDKDTEGLLIMTNDGGLAHRLLSPRKHVRKVYYVELEQAVTEEALRMLERGVDIGEKAPTLPALTEQVAENSLLLTITEGKFHQVKRMMRAVGNEVVYLKRTAMGTLKLDESLPCGSHRELSPEETDGLIKETAAVRQPGYRGVKDEMD